MKTKEEAYASFGSRFDLRADRREVQRDAFHAGWTDAHLGAWSDYLGYHEHSLVAVAYRMGRSAYYERNN